MNVIDRPRCYGRPRRSIVSPALSWGELRTSRRFFAGRAPLTWVAAELARPVRFVVRPETPPNMA